MPTGRPDKLGLCLIGNCTNTNNPKAQDQNRKAGVVLTKINLTSSYVNL